MNKPASGDIMKYMAYASNDFACDYNGNNKRVQKLIELGEIHQSLFNDVAWVNAKRFFETMYIDNLIFELRPLEHIGLVANKLFNYPNVEFSWSKVVMLIMYATALKKCKYIGDGEIKILDTFAYSYIKLFVTPYMENQTWTNDFLKCTVLTIDAEAMKLTQAEVEAEAEAGAFGF